MFNHTIDKSLMQGVKHVLEISPGCLHEDHPDQIVHFDQLLSQSCNYITII